MQSRVVSLLIALAVSTIINNKLSGVGMDSIYPHAVYVTPKNTVALVLFFQNAKKRRGNWMKDRKNVWIINWQDKCVKWMKDRTNMWIINWSLNNFLQDIYLWYVSIRRSSARTGATQGCFRMVSYFMKIPYCTRWYYYSEWVGKYYSHTLRFFFLRVQWPPNYFPWVLHPPQCFLFSRFC